MIRYLNFIYDIIILVIAFFAKIFFYKTFNLKSYPSTNKKKTTIIIVNGPSLKKDMKNILYKKNKFKDKFEFYAANYFASSKEFEMIKPNFYAFADPIFWRKNINNDFKRDNSKLYKNLFKVNWDMYLLCPIDGIKSVSKKLRGNKYIKIIPIRSNFYNLKTEKINIFAHVNNIITPLFINVLILLFWNAIQRKVSYIEIYGADFSAFKELSVDQRTNELSSLYTHFYKNTKAQVNAGYKYPGMKKKKIHTRFFQIWNAFNQMYLLSIVAKKLKIKVINCSSHSYLDSIDRLNKKNNDI